MKNHKLVIDKYADGIGISREFDADFDLICMMTNMPDGEEKDYANLFVSAPELLDALKACLSAGDEQDPILAWSLAVANAQKIIAKAEAS